MGLVVLEIEFHHVTNDSINRAYVMKPPWKPWMLRLGELPGWCDVAEG